MNKPVTGDELLSLIQITSSLLQAFVFPFNPCSPGLLLGTEEVSPEDPHPPSPVLSVLFSLLLQPPAFPQCCSLY